MIAARQGIIAKQNNLVGITLYSSQGVSGLNGYEVFYSTALCSGWDAWPSGVLCPSSETCDEYGKLYILSNTTVYVTVKECSGTYIQFNAADNTNTCPANEGNYCYNFDSCEGTAFSFNSGTVKEKNIAIKVYVISSGKGYSYVSCL
jgi:hypothetical protein